MGKLLSGCCCFNLKTGSYIVGTLYLCLGIFGFFLTIGILVNVDFYFSPYGPFHSIAENRDCDDYCMNHLAKLVKLLLSFKLFYLMFTLAAASLLIHGIYNKKPYFLNAFLVRQFLELVVLGSIVLLNFWLMFLEPLLALVSTVVFTGFFMLSAYFFIVVKDYQTMLYQSLGELPTSMVEECPSAFDSEA